HVQGRVPAGEEAGTRSSRCATGRRAAGEEARRGVAARGGGLRRCDLGQRHLVEEVTMTIARITSFPRLPPLPPADPIRDARGGKLRVAQYIAARTGMPLSEARALVDKYGGNAFTTANLELDRQLRGQDRWAPLPPAAQADVWKRA